MTVEKEQKILPFFLIVCLCIHYYSESMEKLELSGIRVSFMKKFGSKKPIKSLKSCLQLKWAKFCDNYERIRG